MLVLLTFIILVLNTSLFKTYIIDKKGILTTDQPKGQSIIYKTETGEHIKS